MKRYPPTSPLIVLIGRFLVLIALFFLTRLIFFWFNNEIFSIFTSAIFWQGLRFDVAAICILNAPYFLLLLLPFRFISNRTFRTIGNVYFITINSIALLTNLIDTCYYPFSMRRMTGDIFSFIGETNNFGDLVPIFLKEYWYIGLIWIALIGALFLSTYLTEKKIHLKTQENHSVVLAWISHLIIRMICIFLIIVGARGGLQMRPLTLTMAGGAAGVENAPLVLNSPYSLLSTLKSSGLKRFNYFDDKQCTQIFDTHRNIIGKYTSEQVTNVPQNGKTIDYDHPINIVLIILEGISAEYSDYLAEEPKRLAGFTPFLDSLAQNSIVFKGMSNGHQSIEALSSILGGIPALMENPFSQSRYAVYDIPSAVSLLSQYGKRTMFFHGGKNGTMGFDRYCHIVGINEYYGMSEYPHEEDYDGTWGIKDMPYLQYVAEKLEECSDPFFATIFTLSSHHPFTVADEFKGELPDDAIPMQRSVAYTDEALRLFFERAKQSSWYENTLFVITSDHTNFFGAVNVDHLRYRYSIPMILYWPKGKERYRSERIMQQVDIMPTIFDFCNISGKFTSFGHSAFDDNAPHFAINYHSRNYQFYSDRFLFQFNGEEIIQLWKFDDGTRKVEKDSIPNFQQREKLMKAVIQKFNNGLIDNDL